MATIHELAEDWRAMKVKLEKQLETLEHSATDEHGPIREKLKQWIVELDDLIITYSFPI